LLEFIAKLPVCEIVMEACGGANYWARKFKEYGHEVKLISPQFVKPFVKGNKNHYKDAEAIVEASSRPSMRYVTPNKSEKELGVHHEKIATLLTEKNSCFISFSV
jgi:transposase